MALLDYQVPEDAKQVTVDLLQRCVGSICVVKYGAEVAVTQTQPCTIICGMVAGMIVPWDKELGGSKITIYPSMTDPVEIPGNAIEYIYSLSMLPGAMRLDVPDLMAPPV